MSHQSDLPPHVPSCVSTGAGVTVPDATSPGANETRKIFVSETPTTATLTIQAKPTPDATATPRTDANTGKAIAGHYGPSDSTDLYACPGGPFVHADFARTLERELSAAQASLAEAKAEVAQERRMRQTMETRHGEVVAYNSQVRAEVDRLNREVDTLLFIKADCDQLRARVAAMEAQLTSLEADKARLAYVIANGLPKCAFGEEWHYGDYNSAVVYETPEAAIDAARAGKGAP